MRADDPDEPLWRGVDRIDVRADAASVGFRRGVDPVLTSSGEVQVACHLYDEYAPLAVEEESR
jgi:peptide/nickel transport system ATP-binding protein